MIFKVKFYTWLLAQEGGYTNIDGGTNKGIRFETYKNLCKAVYHQEPTKEHFLSLSDNDVYKMVDYFYYLSGSAKIKDIDTAQFITQFYWGSGSWAISTLIKTLNKFYNSNIIDKGKNSILTNDIAAKVNSITNKQKFLQIYAVEFKSYIDRLVKAVPAKKVYYNTWIRRLNSYKDIFLPGTQKNFLSWLIPIAIILYITTRK